jgi:phosphoribosylamine--glycine ligase
MGSVSPTPRLSGAEADGLIELVHVPVLRELARRGTPFSGALFAGVMLTPAGPRVLEFNCRFGDPETQSQLPRLGGDLLEALAASAAGKLGGVELPVSDRAAVTVVLAGRDYPERSDVGTPIEGIAEAEAAGAHVFHAGTALHDGRLVTNGGRVLDVTALGDSVADARAAAYEAASRIHFDGVRFRRDIASA